MKKILSVVPSLTEGIKIPNVEVSFVSEEDRYGLILPNRGNLQPLTISPEAGIYGRVNIEKMLWNYLSIKRNCKHYSVEEDSYMKCLLKNQVDCFRFDGPNNGCNCVPENTHKTHFEKYPISWNSCKTNEEYYICRRLMEDCFRRVMNDEEKCPLSCKQELYIGQKRNINGFSVKLNNIFMRITYTTMETEIHDEVLIQEVSNFIGTVGGSLGLFIGFSYTGFVEQVLDYFMQEN